MKASEIKSGKWYETKLGTGKVIGPPSRGSVRIHIVYPVPRGEINISTRDFLNESQEPPRKDIGE